MDSSPHRPAVEIIVLNWNGGAFLPDCLAALDRQIYPEYSVTVVDNGSTDGSLAWVRRHYPAIKLIENGLNLGFAAGNNVALRQSTADIVALLNPDVVVAPDWVAQLVEAMSSDSRIGVVGSKLWYPDGRTIQHGGGFLRPPQAMPGHYAIGEMDTGQVDESRLVDYVIGGAIAIRRETLEAIGLLDEGYFLYFEDADYCERARRAGWQVLYAPEATAIHVESATAIKGSFAYLQRFHTGRWRYVLKHYTMRMIVDQSIAAEMQWLALIDKDERLAAALAYQSAISVWHELLVAREREGVGALDATDSAILRESLVALREAAFTPPQPAIDLQQLADVAEVIEPTAESEPSFSTLFQNHWNDVATYWYIRPLVAQQNRFNQAILPLLSERWQAQQKLIRRITQMQAIHAALQEDTRELIHTKAEMQEQIDLLETQLAARRTGQ